jgi:hypothetical protein
VGMRLRTDHNTVIIFLDVLNELRGEFFHKISDLMSQYIYNILYRKDLSWKYEFEKIDEEILKKEPFGFPGFIYFCELK